MGLRKNFKTDRAKETEGVTIEVDTNDHNGEPITITISRMGASNKEYTKALEEATRPHQTAIQNETLDNELGSKIMRDVFVDTILKGWGNLPKSELSGDPNDKDLLPFSRENAIALFDEMPDVYTDWEARARKASNFREEARKKSVKN